MQQAMRITITKRRDYYSLTHSDNDTMNVVGYFLLDEVGLSRARGWLDWLATSEDADIAGNYTFLEKERGIITLGCLYDRDPYERALEVPITAMITLLEQWERVRKTEPQEIVVTYQDEKFTVEGK